MSKYTVQLRYLIENNVPLFDFPYPFFSEAYRSTFEAHFLEHFFFREIGSETLGVFKHYLKRVFNETLPYYNELFKASTIDYNIFNTMKLVESQKRNVAGTNDSTYNSSLSEHGSSSIDGTGNNNENMLKKFLDTPQGKVDLIDKYLTNTTSEFNNVTSQTSTDGTTTNNSNSNTESNTKMNTDENSNRTLEGHTNISEIELMKQHIELQKILTTIELNFFNECNDLFMLIY